MFCHPEVSPLELAELWPWMLTCRPLPNQEAKAAVPFAASTPRDGPPVTPATPRGGAGQPARDPLRTSPSHVDRQPEGALRAQSSPRQPDSPLPPRPPHPLHRSKSSHQLGPQGSVEGPGGARHPEIEAGPPRALQRLGSMDFRRIAPATAPLPASLIQAVPPLRLIRHCPSLNRYALPWTVTGLGEPLQGYVNHMRAQRTVTDLREPLQASTNRYRPS